MHLINHLPSPTINNQSQYLCLHSQHPTYHPLHPFGCVCFVLLPPHERTKLSAQFVRCAFLGYAPHQKGYICYYSLSKRLRISRHVTFLDKQYFFSVHDDCLSQFSTHSLLPPFENDSPPNVVLPIPITRFRPGLVYAGQSEHEGCSTGPPQ